MTINLSYLSEMNRFLFAFKNSITDKSSFTYEKSTIMFQISKWIMQILHWRMTVLNESILADSVEKASPLSAIKLLMKQPLVIGILKQSVKKCRKRDHLSVINVGLVTLENSI